MALKQLQMGLAWALESSAEQIAGTPDPGNFECSKFCILPEFYILQVLGIAADIVVDTAALMSRRICRCRRR